MRQIQRFKEPPSSDEEQALLSRGYRFVAGIDEVGHLYETDGPGRFVPGRLPAVREHDVIHNPRHPAVNRSVFPE